MVRERTREPIDTATEIDTPERIRFSCRLAGPAQRGAAYLLDLLVRGGILAMLVLVLSALGFSGQTLAGLGAGLVIVAAFLLEWGYYVGCELFMRGQSIGKRALGLRVVRSDGLPIGFGDSMLRNLLRAADFLPALYALGIVSMGLDPKFRRLGDLAAGTIVVSERSDEALPNIELSPPATSAELAALPARVLLNANELEAVELFLRRRSQLNALREEELAELVAPVFARRMRLRYRDPVRFLALLYLRATRAGLS